MSAPNDPMATPPPAPLPPPPPTSYAPPPAYVPPLAPPKKRKTWLWVLLIILSVILLSIGGCCAWFYSYVKSHAAITPESAMAMLHLRMTTADDATIYNESDPAYKQAVTRAQSDAMFDRIHSALGNPSKAQILEKNGRTVDGQDVEELVVLTTFTKGSANETIEFRKGADDQYHLTHYGAESDNLR